MKEEKRNSRIRKRYWHSIDFVKGILTVLVFAGHIIIGVLRDTYPRYLIYSFHMPLFIGISGFLTGIGRIDSDFKEFKSYYWKRLIRPWMIAVEVFYLGNHLSILPYLKIRDIVMAFLAPYYHLWFVIGYMAYVIGARLIWKAGKNFSYNWLILLGISALISFASQWEIYSGLSVYLGSAYAVLRNNFRFYYFLFFTVGLYLRHLIDADGDFLMNRTAAILEIFTACMLMIVAILFFFSYDNIEKTFFFLMNLCLLTDVTHVCINGLLPRNGIFEFLGKFSFPVYLYHPICKLLGSYLFLEGTWKYYAFCTVSFILGCCLVYPLSRIGFINTVIFGSTSLEENPPRINRVN